MRVWDRSCHLGALSLGRARWVAAASAQGLQGLSQPRPAMACTHLGLDTLQGLLQQQREAAHLTLEPIVVVGQGPKCWLQRQQVGPDTYGDTRGERQTG